MPIALEIPFVLDAGTALLLTAVLLCMIVALQRD
jgi:hypothetical protein